MASHKKTRNAFWGLVAAMFLSGVCVVTLIYSTTWVNNYDKQRTGDLLAGQEIIVPDNLPEGDFKAWVEVNSYGKNIYGDLVIKPNHNVKELVYFSWNDSSTNTMIEYTYIQDGQPAIQKIPKPIYLTYKGVPITIGVVKVLLND